MKFRFEEVEEGRESMKDSLVKSFVLFIVVLPLLMFGGALYIIVTKHTHQIVQAVYCVLAIVVYLSFLGYVGYKEYKER